MSRPAEAGGLDSVTLHRGFYVEIDNSPEMEVIWVGINTGYDSVTYDYSEYPKHTPLSMIKTEGLIRVDQFITSPDGKWIVYVKPVTGEPIGTGLDDFPPSELWQVDSNGRHPTLLVRCHESFDHEMSTVVAQFNELRFSPDGRLVYFETPAWATSGALHVVDTTTGREHFICSGGIDSFRGNNLVTEESVYRGHGHQLQKFLRSPEGKMLGTLSQPFDRS
jgi:hypothetical protein